MTQIKATSALSFAPKFVRGNLVVRDGQTEGNYQKCLISLSGVFGLHWPPFVPVHHFGKIVKVRANFTIGNRPYTFETPATVTREITMRTERMGLKFQFPNDEIRDRVAAVIESHGHTPTEYARKYPRIPSSQFTAEFKLRASGTALDSPINPTPQKIAYRIGNLSPNGLLMTTSNDGAKNIRPGDLIDLKISGDPKGLLNKELTVKARVYRVLQEVNPLTQEETWSFGMQFFRLEERHKQTYFKLLQDILNRIKSSNG